MVRAVSVGKWTSGSKHPENKAVTDIFCTQKNLALNSLRKALSPPELPLGEQGLGAALLFLHKSEALESLICTAYIHTHLFTKT